MCGKQDPHYEFMKILEATVKGDNITTLPFPVITAKFPGEKNKGKKFPHWHGFIKRPVSKHCINLKPFITNRIL